MDNQEVLNQAIKIDQKVFHNLLVAREYFEGLSFIKKSLRIVQLVVLANVYRARQLSLLESTRTPQKGYKKAYEWLVNKFTNGGGNSIGALPLIPIAIIAATALVGGTLGNTYITKKQQAQRDLAVTNKLLQALAEEVNPEVKKAIAARLNVQAPGTASNFGLIASGGIAIILLGIASKFVK